MNENINQKKCAKPSLALACVALISIVVFCFPKPVFCVAQNDPEAEAVMQAARNYLDAEVRRDYPSVYASFAPSSDYVRQNSFEQYLADARVTQERVVKYRIIAISYIKKNENKLNFTAVDKIAEVEVDVTFLHDTTKHRSVINIGFIFLKEGGKWYKS